VIFWLIACADVPETPSFDLVNPWSIQDHDQDGFGEADCDDHVAAVHPGAPDPLGDDADTNCDGVDGVDDDGDGVASGPDCNDADATIYEGADEIPWDGIDQDCDGVDEETWVEAEAGGFHTCGLRTDQRVDCWGDDTWGQASAPADTFSVVSAGRDHTCGVTLAGSIACWGRDTEGQVSGAPTSGAWLSVAAGAYHSCGIDDIGAVSCWGADDGSPVDRGQSSDALEGRWDGVAAGFGHSCAVRANADIGCWGIGDDEPGDEGQVSQAPEDGAWLWVGTGVHHSCALGENLKVHCWGAASGPNDLGQVRFRPFSDYRVLTVGDYHGCSIHEDDEENWLHCWGVTSGDLDFGQVRNRPAYDQIDFTDVSAGGFHSCAVRAAGTMECWGRNTEGQLDVPN
jgi:hypothetical protein